MDRARHRVSSLGITNKRADLLNWNCLSRSITVDRLTRKDLKTDKFALEVGNTWEFLTEHRDQALRYGIVAVAIIIAAGGYYFYSKYRAGAREVALEQALRVDDATVGAQPQPPLMNFPTAEE